LQLIFQRGQLTISSKVCDKVIDLEDQKLNRTRVSHVSSTGFEIDDFSVHLIGTCAACRQAKTK